MFHYSLNSAYLSHGMVSTTTPNSSQGLSADERTVQATVLRKAVVNLIRTSVKTSMGPMASTITTLPPMATCIRNTRHLLFDVKIIFYA
jgi:hypothetical protein